MLQRKLEDELLLDIRSQIQGIILFAGAKLGTVRGRRRFRTSPHIFRGFQWGERRTVGSVDCIVDLNLQKIICDASQRAVHVDQVGRIYSGQD